MLTCSNAPAFANLAIASFAQYPKTFSGRGIVTCGGGIKYGACAWVLINLLRHHSCTLPIEVWCLDDDEFDPWWIDLVEPLGVVCVNAAEVARHHPHRGLTGWELKPYSILHSRFRHVLFLDADNVPLVDPSFLFETPQYHATGTIFWPDPAHFETPSDSERWKVFGVPYRKSPDQESGQLLVDKERCWQALNLCNWYNEHSNFYYRYVYGDKETFRFAWQRLETPISWPAKFASEEVRFTLIQHDFEGRSIFQHRFYRKWSLYGPNIPIPDFQLEQLCLEFLDKLRQLWQPQKHLMRRATAEDREVMRRLAGRRFLYDRPGHNSWPIRLGSDGYVEEGFGPNEFFWWCEAGQLVFAGTDGRRKSVLDQIDGDAWSGTRVGTERVQVHLAPLATGLVVAG